MDELIKELRSTVAENPEVTVVNEQLWKLPSVLYEVSFSQVKRLKMDILMKMLLLSFQEADIRRAATLAEMLFVEELFIRDLIDKMQRTGLIQLEKPGYKLTTKGYDYLSQGIFDEEIAGDETVIAYSASHDNYKLAEENRHPEAEEPLPVYRYPGKGSLNKERMQQLLFEKKSALKEEGFQTIVTGITACIEQITDYLPCIEFQLYDEKQDIFYARVWNTATGGWDEMLEQQIEARELVKWRKVMEEQKVALS